MRHKKNKQKQEKKNNNTRINQIKCLSLRLPQPACVWTLGFGSTLCVDPMEGSPNLGGPSKKLGGPNLKQSASLQPLKCLSLRLPQPACVWTLWGLDRPCVWTQWRVHPFWVDPPKNWVDPPKSAN